MAGGSSGGGGRQQRWWCGFRRVPIPLQHQIRLHAPSRGCVHTRCCSRGSASKSSGAGRPAAAAACLPAAADRWAKPVSPAQLARPRSNAARKVLEPETLKAASSSGGSAPRRSAAVLAWSRHTTMTGSLHRGARLSCKRGSSESIHAPRTSQLTNLRTPEFFHAPEIASAYHTMFRQ